MIDDRLGVADDVGELWTELSIEDDPGSVPDDSGKGDVGEGNTLGNEVGASRQVLLDGLEATNGALGEVLVGSLAVRKNAAAELVDDAEVLGNLVVSYGDPLVNEGSSLDVRGEEGGVGGKSSNWQAGNKSVKARNRCWGESESG